MCLMRDVLLLLSTILYYIQVKYIHVSKYNVKTAVKQTGAKVSIKPPSLTCDF